MSSSQPAPATPSATPKRHLSLPARLALYVIGLLASIFLIAGLLVGFVLALAYPNLPALDALTDYRPKVPLRIYTADHVLIGEFGEERRNLVHIKDVPDIMKKAVLAIEDDRFYEHGGVDYQAFCAPLSITPAAAPSRAPARSPCKLRAISSFPANKPTSAKSMRSCSRRKSSRI